MVLHVCLGPFSFEWGEVGGKEEDVERSQLSPNVAKHFGLHTQDRVRQGLTPKVWRKNNESGKEEEKTPHSKYEEEKTMEVEEEEDYTHNWDQEFAQLAWSISILYISIYNFICTRDPSLHNAFKYLMPCSSQNLRNPFNKCSPDCHVLNSWFFWDSHPQHFFWIIWLLREFQLFSNHQQRQTCIRIQYCLLFYMGRKHPGELTPKPTTFCRRVLEW